jgi:valyl-tRNA synthetase
MDAVTSGRVKFFPERYAKTYLDWLGEKRDWCISRQLWWGHQIPVWRGLATKFWASYNQNLPADAEEFGPRIDQWDDVQFALSGRKEEGQWFYYLCFPPGHPSLESELKRMGFVQDPDVLDTWFSSGLWPHSTMGWPGPAFPDQPKGPQNPEWSAMRYYYPTSVLVTGRDIITLWVARMVMMSLANLGEVPFRHVYIHPKVLDGFGETMSKSKGNGVDPLDVIDFYGTDALRFVIASMATETQDARLPVANVCPHCQTLVPVKNEHMYMRTRKINCPSCKKPFRPGGPWPTPDAELPTAKQTSEKFELGRNFATKLWNASRFVLMNLGEEDRSQKTEDRMGATGGSSASAYHAANIDASTLKLEDRWILSRLASVSDQVTKHLDAYELANAARLLYDFTWSEFCDWYVEMAKSRLKDPAERPLAQRMLAGVLDVILRLLHPIMPFVTETVWQALNQAAPQRGLLGAEAASTSVMIAPWPRTIVEFRDPGRELHVARMQELIKLIRNARNEYRVDERTTVTVSVKCSPQVASELQPLSPFVQSLGKVDTLHLGPDVQRPAQAAAGVHPDFTAYVHLAGLIDVAAEVKRLEKQLGEKEKQLTNLKAKLANQGFLAKAPAEVVGELRESEKATEQQLEVLRENLTTLKT